MGKLTPTQRTLAHLRKEGWTVQVVEKWNAFAKIRQDLFGCIDLVACRPGMLLGVQATSMTNVSARVTKSLAEPRLLEWLRAGGQFWVIGWGKKGKAGTVKKWTMRKIGVSLRDGDMTTQELP